MTTLNRTEKIDVYKRLEEIGMKRLEEMAARKGISVDELLDELPIGEPGNGLVMMTGNAFRALRKVKTKQEVDSELAKSFEFS